MALKLNRIYTRGGDQGKTSLACGQRVSKSDIQVELYGTTDELNSFIGLLRTTCQDLPKEAAEISEEHLQLIQQQIFNLGALLAVRNLDLRQKMPLVSGRDIELLEGYIDNLNQNLGDLESFVLPGGNRANAEAHVCRTICRRLERMLVAQLEQIEADPLWLQYVNRLSDYFFVFSRWVSHVLKTPEYLWKKTSV